MSNYKKNLPQSEVHDLFSNNTERHTTYRLNRIFESEYEQQTTNKQIVYKAVILSGEHGNISTVKKKKNSGMVLNPIYEKVFPDSVNRAEVKFRIIEVLYGGGEDFTASLPNPVEIEDFYERQKIIDFHPKAYSELNHTYHSNLGFGAIVSIKEMSNLYIVMANNSTSDKGAVPESVVAVRKAKVGAKKVFKSKTSSLPNNIFDCNNPYKPPRVVRPMGGKYKFSSTCSPKNMGTLSKIAEDGSITEAILKAKKIVIFGDSQAQRTGYSTDSKLTEGKYTIGGTLESFYLHLPSKIGTKDIQQKTIERKGAHTTKPSHWVTNSSYWKWVEDNLTEDLDILVILLGGQGSEGTDKLARKIKSATAGKYTDWKGKVIWVGGPPSTNHKAKLVPASKIKSKAKYRKNNNKEIEKILKAAGWATDGMFGQYTFINSTKDIPSFADGYDTRSDGVSTTDGVHVVGKYSLIYLIEAGLIPNNNLYEGLVKA